MTTPFSAWARAWLVAASLAMAGSALAAGYPEKPVKVVVGFAPGGPTDVVARAIFAKVSEQTGQVFVIENRPGANSNRRHREVGGEAGVKLGDRG